MVQGIWQRPRVLHLARTSGRCLGPELAGSEKPQRSRRGLSATYFERDQICPAPRKLECQAAESVCPVTASSGRGRGFIAGELCLIPKCSGNKLTYKSSADAWLKNRMI